MTQSNVRAAFERHFNTHGTLYASAGRINLIGEHTDYNGGFVFPGAVDCGITAMIRPNGTDRVRAYAGKRYSRSFSFDSANGIFLAIARFLAFSEPDSFRK